MRSLVIGLTGGIGSGKTAASNRFASHNITVVDTDVVARMVVEKGRPALIAIVKHFGSAILTDQGELNRALLREIIFQSTEDKTWLEALLHPLIREETLSQIEKSPSSYCILVSPLLIESGQSSLTQRILVIDAPEHVQITRTTIRDNNTDTQVKAIMASQISREQRLAAADDVIMNDGTREELHHQVDQLHIKYLALAKSLQENNSL